MSPSTPTDEMDSNRTRLQPAVMAALVLLAAGLAFGVWLALRAPAGAASPALPTATPRPTLDFQVEDLAGDEVHLSDYRGKVVLVNFWATWCSPCQEEMPVLDAYYQAHHDAGFVLLGVNVSDRPPEAAAYFEEAGYSFPLVFDPPGNVLIDLGARGLPVSLLIDRDGHLVEKWVGPLTADTLDSTITPLLAP